MEVGLPNRLRFGAFELDLKAGELRTGTRRALLQEQPFQLLLMLVERRGEIVTLEEIKKRLWPNDTVVEFNHSIHNAIKKLRRALGDSADNPQYVETVARRGYRLIVPVESESDSSSDSMAQGAPSPSPQARAACPERAEGREAELVGKKVSHYRVLEIVGGGGMGLVYKAEDLKLGRRVALKFLPEELASDPIALQRFEREAQTASSLNHPNICYIHEFGEHEGQPFIAMELLEGETLRDRLAAVADATEEVALDELLRIATQVADGLEAAHEQGIIHRDIKPANIFLTKKGTAKILDFGLAKLADIERGTSDELPRPSPNDGLERGTPVAEASGSRTVEAPDVSPAKGEHDESGLQPRPGLKPDLEEHPDRRGEARLFHQPAAPIEHTLTRTGVAMGTAGYMSPEQVRGEKLDARTDLFSFGLVLYEMATGQRAFTGDTAAILKDAILNHPPVPVHELNTAIPAKLEQVIGRALEKDRERRYQSAAEMRGDLEALRPAIQVAGARPGGRRRWKLVAGAAVTTVAIVASLLYWRSLHRTPTKLAAKDTIVLAQFDNSTGDSIFDGTLRQALDLNLQQSPWLKVLSERKVSEALQTIKHKSSEPLTAALAQQVCRVTHSKAVLTGSIANRGNTYLVGLRVADCETGDILSDISSEAENRDGVIHALGESGTRLRTSLGDPTASQADFNQPLERATTSSLDALQEYVQGLDPIRPDKLVPHLQRAAELDPNFALVHQLLGRRYQGSLQPTLASQSFQKAYELRDRLSLRHRLVVDASYYLGATGELEKALQTFQELLHTFPESGARTQLCYVLRLLGRFQQAVAVCREAIGFNRNEVSPFVNIISSYMSADQLIEAQALLDAAWAQGLNGDTLVETGYDLAFVRGDQSGMQDYFNRAMGKPELEDNMLSRRADTETYYGRHRNAQGFWQQAVELASRGGTLDIAAEWKARQAVWEAEVGSPRRARKLAAAALALREGHAVESAVALALARSGDLRQAERLAEKLNREFPLDTLIQSYELPAIRASIELQKKRPAKAIEILQTAKPYELAATALLPNVLPPYLRGQAYLQAGKGQQAAAEFQKMINHPGMMLNSVLGPLAHLQLGRARAMMGDKAAARKSYQDFLTLWKDADPDIPIYQQAKAEYAKLR